MSRKKPKVAIIMGSKSDLVVMEEAASSLKEFGIESTTLIASAHRTPKKVQSFARSAEGKFDLIIAGAGMAAHLPGVVAAYTTLPVIGVPMFSKGLSGFDALYSIVQMPPGVPVACVSINGAKNAGVLAAEILGLKYPYLKAKLKKFKQNLERKR